MATCPSAVFSQKSSSHPCTIGMENLYAKFVCNFVKILYAIVYVICMLFSYQTGYPENDGFEMLKILKFEFRIEYSWKLSIWFSKAL